MKKVEWDHSFFNVLQNRVVCNLEDVFFQSNGVAGFGVLNLLSFDLLSERCSIV
jgi:hypothetical protein